MRKITFIALLLAVVTINAQNILIDEGFDDITTLTDYTVVNASDTPNEDILQGSPEDFIAFDGADDAYLGMNFNATSGATIDLYLLTPNLNLSNGDQLTFYTRTLEDSNFPDRLQVRLDPTAAGAQPTSENVGSYTELLLEINPDLIDGEYPEEWSQQTVTMSGLPDGGLITKVAFRYWVTDGGPAGNNSNFIGIDRLVVDAVLSTEEVILEGLEVFVSSKTLTINSSNLLTELTLYNLLGQQVKTAALNGRLNTIDLSDLPTGLYLSQIRSNDATTSIKIINK